MPPTPHVAVFAPNGGTDPGTMHIGDRRIKGGWPHEAAVHIPLLYLDPPNRLIFHLPFGSRNPDLNVMEFDALPFARLNPALRRVTDEAEFVAAFLTLHHLAGCQLDFYLGSPENSEVFGQGWARENYAGCEQRIDSSIRPILRLRDRGAKVGLWIDGSAIRDKDSLTAFTHNRCTRVHQIETGIEARPIRKAAWANQPHIPVMAWRADWHGQAGVPDIIPESELLGPQWLICDNAEEAKAELAAGRNVAFIGRLATSAEGSH